MTNRIDTAGARKALTPRREPYWHRIEAGTYLGFRKLEDGTGTWIARWRDDDRKQRYNALGAQPNFDSAAKAARAWFDQCKAGSPDIIDVAEACRRYVSDRRREKGDACADDADGRFRRTIYDKAFGRITLDALRTGHIADWRNDLVKVDDDEDDPDAERRSKDSANRYLATLKAALNLAYRMGFASTTVAWDRVDAFQKVAKRRERFLTMHERRALLAAASPELKRLIRALLLTAARPGEIGNAKVGDLDPTGLLTLQGKTGRRTVPISPAALKHLRQCAGDRADDKALVARDDGRAWTRFEWRDAVREAREAAGLPNDVVLYHLRHVAISEMLVSGIDPMTVARLAGTSVEMISRNYGHLVKDGIVAKLARVKVL